MNENNDKNSLVPDRKSKEITRSESLVSRGLSLSNEITRVYEIDELFETNLSEANKLKRRGEYRDALEKNNYALNIKPKSLKALYLRSEINFNLDLYNCAIDDLNSFIELRPDNIWSIYRRGKIYYYSCMYKEALEDLNHAYNIKPNNHDTLYYRGCTFIQLGFLDNALSDFRKALELNPISKRCLSGYVEVCLILGRYEEAMKELETHNPGPNSPMHLHSSLIYYLRSLVFHVIGKPYSAYIKLCDAINLVNKHTDTFSKDIRGLLYEFMFYLALERHHESMECYQKILSLNPPKYFIHDALIDFELLSKLNPNILAVKESISLLKSYTL